MSRLIFADAPPTLRQQTKRSSREELAQFKHLLEKDIHGDPYFRLRQHVSNRVSVLSIGQHPSAQKLSQAQQCLLPDDTFTPILIPTVLGLAGGYMTSWVGLLAALQFRFNMSVSTFILGAISIGGIIIGLGIGFKRMQTAQVAFVDSLNELVRNNQLPKE